MQEHYTLTQKIDQRIKMAVAYGKALQLLRSKKLNKTILIINN